MAVLTSRAALLARVALLPGADALLEHHRRELPQRDELCGPFGALLALRSMGLGAADADPVLDQDTVAAAVERLSGGALAIVPASGLWDAERARGLLRRVAAAGPFSHPPRGAFELCAPHVPPFAVQANERL